MESVNTVMNDSDDVWLLDSGASVHMTYKKNFFRDFQEFTNENRIVTLGNEQIIKANGIGTIQIKKCINGQWEENILTNVLYVPDLRRNLFSEGAIMHKGFEIVKKNKSALIYKDGKIVLTANQSSNNLYTMNFTTIINVNSCNTTQDKKSDLKVWHERLGHLNIKEIRNMIKLDLIQCEDSDCENFVCEACMYGKQSRLPFHISQRGQLQPGDLVYSDVCGPMSKESVRGMKYFVLFKDAASSYRHVFFMKHKSEVLDNFKIYNAIIKNKFNHNIRVLHSDNGKEYINNNFNDFLKLNGIVHECTAPYTPQQNGRAERELRTIVESARSMLYGRDLPLILWAEAVNCAVYLLNRTPSSQTPNKSPYEIWTGEKPNLKHIRVFGSYGYVHVPDACRTKLEKKSHKMIMVGYENDNYRMYDCISHKIKISRDVIFNEASAPAPKNSAVIDVDVFSSNQLPTSPVPVSPQRDDTVMSSDESLASCENDPLYEPPPSRLLDEEPLTLSKNLRPRLNQDNYEINMVEYCVPTTYHDAISGPDSTKWIEAIDEELKAHKESNTWTITNKTDKKPITSKWVFRIKKNKQGEIERYKARLCARGFNQIKNIDYTETFAPTTRYDSIRILFSLASKYQYEILQFDVKTAFLYGELNEEIYMEIPDGVSCENGKVCKLNKSLYGLKQAPRCWNIKFTNFLKTYGFIQCQSDSCVFVGYFNKEKVILILYVDDGLIFSSNKMLLQSVIKTLKSTFNVKVLDMNYFVGLEVNRTNDSICLTQVNYIEQIIEKFNMSSANPCSTPIDPNIVFINNSEDVVNFPYREAVGSLLFLASVTRPDIAFAVNIVCRYVNNPSFQHVNAVKRIIRYLIGTKHIGIQYKSGHELVGYSDSDFAGDVESRKSTTGYLYLMNNGPITWASHKQQTVALSTMEAEFMAACDAAKELLWLKQFLTELGESQCKCTDLFVDNQAAIKLISNPVYHKRSKHIDIKYNFIREKVELGYLSVKYISSNMQLSDFLTKALPTNKFVLLRNQVLN